VVLCLSKGNGQLLEIFLGFNLVSEDWAIGNINPELKVILYSISKLVQFSKFSDPSSSSFDCIFRCSLTKVPTFLPISKSRITPKAALSPLTARGIDASFMTLLFPVTNRPNENVPIIVLILIGVGGPHRFVFNGIKHKIHTECQIDRIRLF